MISNILPNQVAQQANYYAIVFLNGSKKSESICGYNYNPEEIIIEGANDIFKTLPSGENALWQELTQDYELRSLYGFELTDTKELVIKRPSQDTLDALISKRKNDADLSAKQAIIDAKHQEIEEYYTKLRDFNILHGKISMPVSANEVWFNTISNVISGLEDASRVFKTNIDKLYYDYYFPEGYIRLPYILLLQLRLTISKQRSLCRVNADLHKIKLTALIEVASGQETQEVANNYNYKTDLTSTLEQKPLVVKIQDIAI